MKANPIKNYEKKATKFGLGICAIVVILIVASFINKCEAQTFCYYDVSMQKFTNGSFGRSINEGKYFRVTIQGAGYAVYMSHPTLEPFRAYVQFERVQWEGGQKWYVYNLKRDKYLSGLDILISTTEKMSDMAKYGPDAFMIFAMGYGVDPVLYTLKKL
jgi:hypothetical protein